MGVKQGIVSERERLQWARCWQKDVRDEEHQGAKAKDSTDELPKPISYIERGCEEMC